MSDWSLARHSIAIAHSDCIFIVCVRTCGYNMTIYTYMYGVCFYNDVLTIILLYDDVFM